MAATSLSNFSNSYLGAEHIVFAFPVKLLQRLSHERLRLGRDEGASGEGQIAARSADTCRNASHIYRHPAHHLTFPLA